MTIVRCRDCGLVYADPRPVPETLEQHYDMSPDDYWSAKAHGRFFDPATDHYGQQISTFRRLWAGSATPRALDVGAGIGRTMTALGRAGFDAYGVEPSPAFYERAIALGADPARLTLTTIESAEYEPRSFDLVTFGAVLEHLHDPALALEHILPWIASDGLVYVEVPFAKWLMARLLNVFYRAQGSDYVTNLSPMHPPFHLYEFTLESFHRHGDRVGYRVASHEIVPCQTFLPGPAARIAERLMEATDTGMMLLLWLRRSNHKG